MLGKETVSINASHTLLVKGPSSVRVLSGVVSVFGYEVQRRESIIARPWRVIPLHAKSDAEVEIERGEGASLQLVDSDTIPESWKELSRMLGEDFRILLIGGTDVGKSSLTTFLYNETVTREKKVTVVEIDSGQSEFCPPTTMGITFGTRPTYDLYQLRAELVFPFGYTSPQMDIDLALKVAGEVASSIPSDPTIIDSDGWVREEGIQLHKSSIVRLFKPTDVVIIGEVESAEYLKSVADELGARLHHIESPSVVAKRGKEARKLLREVNYARYLKGSSLITIPSRWVKVDLMRGSEGVESYLKEVTAELEVCGCIDAERLKKVRGLDTSRAGFGLISYVFGEDGSFKSLGIFMGMDSTKSSVKIYTNHRGPIKSIKLGGVVLTTELEELHVCKQST